MACRVAVIGAGASGLSQLFAFETARAADQNIPEIVCYEKQSDWGGLWNYSWRTGLDEFGESVHSSMYKSLWILSPKECMELANYTFMEHFNKPVPSFPPRAVILNYITGRAKKNDLRKYIHFSTVVRWVEFHDKEDKFHVTVKDLKDDTMRTEKFDWVIVATGHFSVPNYPEFPGLSSFPGRVLHSHDFRDASEFANMRVLIIGRSYSAEDIANQCLKYNAKSVVISYRKTPFGWDWPETLSERPLLQNLQGRTAHFIDGSTAEVDAIVLCTGYRHHFPFLPDQLRLKTGNVWYPQGLYKGIFWDKNTKLIYLGMQNQCFTFPMFDAQAWYARDVIQGNIPLPDAEQRTNDMARWAERACSFNQEDIGDIAAFQAAYLLNLLDATDYPKFDIAGMVEMFLKWERTKHEKDGILNFRDKPYHSLIDGTVAPQHHTKWTEELDDSLNNFVNGPKTNGQNMPTTSYH